MLVVAFVAAIGVKVFLDKHKPLETVVVVEPSPHPTPDPKLTSTRASRPMPSGHNPDSIQPNATPDSADRPSDPDGNAIYSFRDGGGLIGEVPSIGPPPYRLRWKYQTDDVQHASVEAAATITPDTVYVADGRGTVHAIDLATGKGKWKYVSDGGFDTTPLVTNSRVFLGDLSGVFHCISAVDGTKVWLFDTESSGIHGSASGDDGNIIFGTDEGQIFCLNYQGKKMFQAAADDRINSAPSICMLPGDIKAALFSGCDAKLRALNLKTGKEVFASDMPSVAAGSPVIAGDRIVVGVDQGSLVCFTMEGKQIWDYTGIRDNATVATTPAVSVSNNIVVVGAQDRQVHAVKLSDGSPLWTYKTRGEVNSSPIISGNRVYTASLDKNIYVLDLLTGKELWKFTTARAVEASPTVGQGVFVISDTRGNVYCFESDNR